MRNVGIICEFNPFHDGHKYLIDNVRAALEPDAVVCVMSGDFVQRGQASLWDKYTRANWAISGGADLVLELPAKYAVNSAGTFARGGIEVMNRLGVISDLAFGSECGDIEALSEASKLEEEEFSGKLKELLSKGSSYAGAYSKASGGDLFKTPNNILGVEYLRALRASNSSIIPHTIGRTEAQSASDIRNAIISGESYNDNYVNHLNFAEYEKRIFAVTRAIVLRTDVSEIAEISEVCEGIENKIKKEILLAENYQDLIFRIKSKRYTYAKLSRVLLKIILGITKKDELSGFDSVKVLALNETGQKVLKDAKEKGSIKFDVSPEDSFAADMYSVLSGRPIYNHSDYVCNSKPTKI